MPGEVGIELLPAGDMAGMEAGRTILHDVIYQKLTYGSIHEESGVATETELKEKMAPKYPSPPGGDYFS